jgi:hypothetical protein
VANLLDERPLALYGKLQPSPGSSRQDLIRRILQLVLNASNDCDMYERRARYRKSLKGMEVAAGSADSRSPSGVSGTSSHSWPSSLQRSLASALMRNARRDSPCVASVLVHKPRGREQGRRLKRKFQRVQNCIRQARLSTEWPYSF